MLANRLLMAAATPPVIPENIIFHDDFNDVVVRSISTRAPLVGTGWTNYNAQITTLGDGEIAMPFTGGNCRVYTTDTFASADKTITLKFMLRTMGNQLLVNYHVISLFDGSYNLVLRTDYISLSLSTSGTYGAVTFGSPVPVFNTVHIAKIIITGETVTYRLYDSTGVTLLGEVAGVATGYQSTGAKPILFRTNAVANGHHLYDFKVSN